MSRDDSDGPPRAVGVELIQDISRISSPIRGFLRRHRHRVKTLLSDGSRTDTYIVDYVDRPEGRRDAVAAVAYQPVQPGRPIGETIVLLREQVRYPPMIVSGRATIIEVVAGLIEGDEAAEAAAVRELVEEAGIEVPLESARRIGGMFYVSPGILTERIAVVAIRLPPDAFDRPLNPLGDGSAMEEGAELMTMTLDDALDLSDRGGTNDRLQICDAKTELALFRLKRMLEGES